MTLLIGIDVGQRRDPTAVRAVETDATGVGIPVVDGLRAAVADRTFEEEVEPWDL